MPSDHTQELARLAREALMVQDASNLCGVMHRFGQVIEKLWEVACDAPQGSRAFLTNHPVYLLWLNKLNHLMRRPELDGDEYHKACVQIEQLIHLGLDQVYGTKEGTDAPAN